MARHFGDPPTDPAGPAHPDPPKTAVVETPHREPGSASWGPPGQLSRPVVAWAGGDGRGLPGPGRTPGAPSGPEGPTSAALDGRELPAAVHPRIPDGGGDRPSEHHPRVRRG